MRVAFDRAGVPLCLLAPNLTVLGANARWLRWTGFTAAQLVGRDILEIFPDTRQLALSLYERVQQGECVDVPCHGERVGSRNIWWEGQLSPIPMESGTGVLVTARAVPALPAEAEVGGAASPAERRQLDEAVRLRPHVSHTPLGVIEWDATTRVTGYRGRGEHLFGWSADEITGKRIHEVPWIAEADWPVVDRAMRELATGARPTNVLTLRCRRKDGSAVHCEWYNSALHDGDGKLVSVLSLVLDVTERVEAETAAREAAESLRLAQDAAGMGSWEWQAGTCDLALSDRCRALFGLAADARPTYPALLAAIDPEDRDRVDRALREAFAAGTECAVELRVPGAGGRARWVAARGRAFRDAQGHVAAMRGVALDVTAAKANEEALRERLALEERLATVALTVPGVLYCYHLRADGIASCPFSTPAGDEIFGMPHEAVVEDITPLFARVPNDDLQRLLESIAESARTLSRWHGLFRYQHPTKGERWIEAWSVPRPQPDASVLWYGYATDVTERMSAHETLRESERRYRSFFHNLLELVGVHEAVRGPGGEVVDWVVRNVNAPALALLGKSREDVIGKRHSDLLGPDTTRALSVAWPDVLATGRPVQYEFSLLGRVLWVSAARMDADTVSAVADDITERKRAEEALREADRRKSEFLAILSHELRNPLAPIRHGIHLLERAQPGSEQALRARAVIRRQTEHLARLVDDLLDVTRVSRGKIELQRARIDLREVVQRTCDDLHTLFESRGIALRTDVSPRPVWVDADATRLAQVVGNLLQNAAKFSHECGAVALALFAAGGHATLRVRDEGVGVPPDLLPRMFEPFVQADRSLARTRGGLGLGLALVKALVELHGGSVTAHSEGPDRGTELIVVLPLAAPPGDGRREVAPGRAGPALVLVIEDNEDAASTLAAVLEEEGHRVHVATDGRSGLARAHELRPEIILCDIGLPDIDGYEIAHQLRREPAFRSTRLVAVSGYARPDDRRRALEAGFDAHVAKPAPLDALLASLRAG